MKEIKLKEDLEKIYPLIKQLRNNLSLKDFLDKIQLATQTQHYKLFAYENDVGGKIKLPFGKIKLP